MTEANTTFGLPQSEAEQIADLKAKLAASEAALKEATAKTPPEDDLGTLDSQGFPKEYVKLEIFAGREKHDLNYAPLGIGGYVLRVQRGVEVIVPKIFVDECLAHAVEEITVQSEGGLVTRPALRFPYHVRGPATEAEYDAQREKGKLVSGAGAALRA